MNTIAIDCGASFIKGALFVDGKIVFETKRQSPVVHERNIPIIEPIQVKALEELVVQILKVLTKHLPDNKYTVCVSNEMHGFLLVDECGEPVTDYISWQVCLGGGLGKKYFEQTCFYEEIKNTGMQLREGLPLCNLWALLHQEFPQYEVSQKTKYRFCDLGSYIIERISGMKMESHPTNAGGTGLFDLRSGEFNRKLIDAVVSDTGYCVEFPMIGTKKYVDGNVTYKPAIGDHQAALLGANMSEKGLSFNLGTGAQVAVVRPMYNISDRWQVQPYFDGKYVHRIPFLPSGRGLNVYFRFFKSIFEAVNVSIEDSLLWTAIQRTSEKTLNPKLTVDLSFFENKVTDHTVGSIQNIGEYDLTFENVVVSILCQMSENFMEASRTLLDDELNTIQEICFTGGIAERFKRIREEIVSNFPTDVVVRMTDKETFLGLNRYANLVNED
ncbi:MAG: hypothetical protein MJ105_03255 [Lachnospiraceae bacterium]|nr:hypothetical protein [Lachnospiraceae bacterium]